MKKKFNWGIVAFCTVMIPFLMYFIFIFLVTDMSTKGNWEAYTNFIFRVGFFFLTSIVSLSIFGNGFKTKLASATAFQQKNFYYMATGITCSLLMVITVFMGSIDTIFSFLNFYILVSKVLFIIVLFIFVLILFDFLSSFWISFTLNGNLRKMRKFGLIEKTQNINNNFGYLNLYDKNVDKLITYAEMYVQNLVFLIKTKNEKILNGYMDEWNSTLSLIYTMIFHANTSLSDKRIIDLYTFMLRSNNILMNETAQHADLKDVHNRLVTNSFKAIPDLYEKHIYHAYKYEKSYNLLVKVYFKELCSALIKLRRTNNSEIYKQMANTELNFLFHHSLESSGAARDFFGGNFSKKKYIEDLFISLIFELIEDAKNEELPVVFSMILSIPEFYPENEIKARLSSTKKKTPVKNKEVDSNDLLSKETIRGCLYAIVKANEIENYRAAGYLIKIITENASSILINREIQNLFTEIKEKKRFKLITSNININNFSLEYCFKKTFLLFNLQFKLKKIEFFPFTDIYDKEDLKYHIDKLTERKKDYSLNALNEENTRKYKD